MHNTHMEERKNAYDMLYGGGKGSVRPTPEETKSPKLDQYESFVSQGTQLLRDEGCPNPAVFFDKLMDFFRQAGWREPPAASKSNAADWRRRSNYRLPPARIEANAKRLREELYAARLRASGPVGPDSPTPEPETPEAATEAP